MAEPRRWEAERSAWIKAQRWPSWLRVSAMRRADILAREARKLDRAAQGRGDSAFQDSETPSLGKRWRRTEGGTTATDEFCAHASWALLVIVFVLYFSVAWLVGKAAYHAWEQVGEQHRVRPWPYVVAAAVAAAVFLIGRPLGLDLLAIHAYAHLLEQATGGLLAPEALSRWYAAGWISWLEIQVVLGLAYGGLEAYLWGWTAPAVRRGERQKAEKQARTTGQASKVNRAEQDMVRVIGRRRPTAVQTEDGGPEELTPEPEIVTGDTDTDADELPLDEDPHAHLDDIPVFTDDRPA